MMLSLTGQGSLADTFCAVLVLVVLRTSYESVLFGRGHPGHTVGHYGQYGHGHFGHYGHKTFCPI